VILAAKHSLLGGFCAGAFPLVVAALMGLGAHAQVKAEQRRRKDRRQPQ
jgi:hypothetical protein